MALRATFFALLSFACGILRAQDYSPVLDVRVIPNPATLDTPVAARVLLDAGIFFTQPPAVSRAGQTVTIVHTIFRSGVGLPPPPIAVDLPIGTLPDGNDSLVYRARSTEGFEFPVITVPFIVLGGTSLAVPGASAQGIAVLALGMLALGVWGFRRSR